MLKDNNHRNANPTDEPCILHELNLGQHTLFIMGDGSIDLFANDEQTLVLADNGLSLDSDETYRLYTSLHDIFQVYGEGE